MPTPSVLLIVLLLPQQTPVREVRLAAPAATLAHEFTQLRGVRELPDGRLLVSDRLEPALYVVDMRSGSLTRIGREGEGPGEYRMPSTLLLLPGDSTLVADEGNARFMIIGPDLKVHRSMPTARAGLVYAPWPRAADRQGRLYFQVPAWASGPEGIEDDSVHVARLDLRTGKLDTLARARRPSEPRVKYGLPYVGFAPQDLWQATSEGRIALVRSRDYHVEWLEPDGRITRGPSVAFTVVPVTERDRVDYMRTFLENSGVGGRGSGSTNPTGISPTPDEMLEPARVKAMAAQNPFAATKPPFTDVMPRIAPDRSLWVERSMPAGSPRTWDVFDASGRITLRVVLPAGRRLLAVGGAGLYLAAVNADGLEALERYQLPR
ncbi:MAG TPA: hypothetical protein VJ817_07715 [Gemmatimonadales bacterium]|nr:hypothetical protein [Gemmatimonadales bacterium]